MGVTKAGHALGGLIVLLALASTGAAGPGECPQGGASLQRVVAIGDVHGDFEGLVSILIASDLIDPELHWVGGRATLVQTGDLLDRGPRVREVLDLLIRLERESGAAGGRVVCLMGNHEAMNLLGVLDEVSPETYAQFVDDRSRSRQRSAWKEQTRLWRRLAARSRKVVVDIPDDTRKEWHERFPPGALEYLEALGPEGEYGRWLRSFPVAVVVGDTLFVHGGLTPALRGVDLEALNRRAAAELAAFEGARKALVERGLALPWSSLLEVEAIAVDELDSMEKKPGERHRDQPGVAAEVEALQAVRAWRVWLLVSDDGPLGTRAASEWDETERSGEMSELIAGLRASRMVVGHSVQASASIESRFDHRVFLIDTGMLTSHYHGRPSALEICGDAVTAIYPTGRRVLTATGSAEAEAPPAAAPPAAADASAAAEAPRPR